MKTILIVEDNDKNMKLARDVLQAKGYATLQAVNGQDGVALALQQRPDLILMDIQLPDINGYEATQRIRADAGCASIPIVAFTASVTVTDRQRITDAGFNGFLGKPIELKSFLATVRQQLGEAD
jgi:two-component system cell cycle response regulator DivK